MSGFVVAGGVQRGPTLATLHERGPVGLVGRSLERGVVRGVDTHR